MIWRFMPNIVTSMVARLLTPAIGFAVALVATIILLVVTKVDVATALFGLWNGSLGTQSGWGAMIVRSTPIALVAVGVSIALRAGVLNVGAEGQLYVGALAGTVSALSLPGPAALNITISLVAAGLVGAAWAFLPAILKVRRKIDEIITTVMMTYIGIQFVSYFISGPLKAEGALFPVTEEVPYKLSILIPNTSASYGFVLAVVIAILAAIVIGLTRAGLSLRAVGANPIAARYAGVRDTRVMFMAMLYSGGLCGLAGAIEILGFQHRLQEGFSPGFGMQGLVAAVLAGGSPVAAVMFSLVLGGLQSGGEELQRQAGVPVAFVFIVQGLAIMLLVANWIRLNPRTPKAAETKPQPSETPGEGFSPPVPRSVQETPRGL
jgi:simple sugar transport system permease protein